MRQSKLLTRSYKNPPKDEVSLNGRLLLQASYVEKVMAGVWSMLPLGFRVLRKIEGIIRDEMNPFAQEILMPTLQPKENWQKTGRWETMTDLFKVIDGSKKEMALGPTHEEIVTPMVARYIFSYKDLPTAVFQIQNKFRMELRAKSGLLRGREFLMKDMYSFHRDEEDLHNFYDQVKETYRRIFNRVGIGHLTFPAFASGGTFSKYSHEFQTITEGGEDTIYLDEDKGIAVNKEVLNVDVLKDLGLKRENLIEKKAIEVGNIFELKLKFSEAFGLKYKDEKGEERPVYMGCFGIGLSRLMGAVVEVLADRKGLVWPQNIAPYQVHLLILDKDLMKKGEEVYLQLKNAGLEILFDDRDVAAGEKLVESDLLGMPWRAVISGRTGDKIELKARTEEAVKLMDLPELIARIKKYE